MNNMPYDLMQVIQEFVGICDGCIRKTYLPTIMHRCYICKKTWCKPNACQTIPSNLENYREISMTIVCSTCSRRYNTYC